MWILLLDLARRHWALLSLGPLAASTLYLVCLAIFRGEPNDPDYAASAGIAFLPYLNLAAIVGSTIDSKVAPVWRTVPLRQSSSAALAWSIMALLPPILQSAITLPLAGLLTWTGTLKPGSFPSVLLFLVLCFLFSGLLAFLRALENLEVSDATTARNRPIPFSRPVAYQLLPIVVAVLMLYRAPWYWSDFTPRYLVCMGLAAGMMGASYHVRHLLLQPTRKKRKRRDEPSISNTPPHRAPTYLIWFRNDLLRSMGKAIMWPSLVFCAYYLFSTYFLKKGFAPLENAAISTSSICAILILSELGKIARIQVYRTLPLSTNQSILLLLAYPYASSLIAIPIVSALLWMAGIGQFHTLMIWAVLITTLSIPFGQFLYARFGLERGCIVLGSILIMGIVGVFTISKVYDLNSVQFLMPSLWGAAAIGTPLALTGYFGLRHLIENSTTVYKRDFEKKIEV